MRNLIAAVVLMLAGVAHADLPLVSTPPGQRYVTQTSTGIFTSSITAPGVIVNKSVAPTDGGYASEYVHLGGTEYTSSILQLIGIGRVAGSKNYSPSYMGFLDDGVSGGSHKGHLVFGTRDVTTDSRPSERLRIMTNGNVGVNTTTPQAQFDVKSSTTPSSYVVAVSSQDGSQIMTISGNGLAKLNGSIKVKGAGTWDAAGTWQFGERSFLGGSNDLSFYDVAGGSEFIRVIQGASGGATFPVGNVGIGTTAPATKLHMSSGTLTVDGSGGGETFTNLTNGNILCAAAGGAIGHCSSAASCTGTCTCTCIAN